MGPQYHESMKQSSDDADNCRGFSSHSQAVVIGFLRRNPRLFKYVASGFLILALIAMVVAMSWVLLVSYALSGHPGDDELPAPPPPSPSAVLPASTNWPSSRAGEALSVGDLKLCWCPPGQFLMGSPAAEPDHRPDEAQVQVTLSKGFWMGKYEVTQGQWKRLMGPIPGKLIAGEGDDFPVYWINFSEAEEFCQRLTKRAQDFGELPTGWEFRLPTEAQWEYACRAGTTNAFSFGQTLSTNQANMGKPYNGTPDGTPGSAASPVGSYPANAWGIHDMHGNEFEWCRDWYHTQLPGGTDPDLREDQGVPNRDGTYSRVRRGGAWTDEAKFCRSALRLRYEPPRRADHIGFRVVLVQR